MELNEQEQQFYEELFQRCDLAKTTKIPNLVAGELFSSSGLPKEVSLQIAGMCGATRLGYFGRSQFYTALKYIAAAQQQLPLNPEVFTTNIALPRINRVLLNAQLTKHAYDAAIYFSQPESQPMPAMAPVIQPMSATGVLPPPPTKKHVRNMSGTINQQLPAPSHPSQLNNSHIVSASHTAQGVSQVNDRSQASGQNDTVSTIPEVGGWASFPSSHVNNGPEPSIAASVPAQAQSPTTATTPGEGPPASPHWNTGGGSSSELSKRSTLANPDNMSLSSADYATSDASESMDDVWCISAEQREYYVNQFRSMQSDLTATIKGPVAKEFFERSRLPTNELSKIWKLSDVNRDGELTLQEFCTAMHLVVLKRNQVELPTTLPPALMPYTPASSEPFAADLGEEQPHRSPSPGSPLVQHETSWPLSSSGEPGASNWTADSTSQWTDQQRGTVPDQWDNADQQWQQTGSEASSSLNWKAGASEANSPLQAQWTGSSHSSHSSKPIQFNSEPAVGDPEIAHPVPVKVDLPSHNKLVDGPLRAHTDLDILTSGSTPHIFTRDRSNTEGLVVTQPLPVRPRPAPKKSQSVSGATMDPMLMYPPPPQAVHGYQGLPGTSHLPPTVPPRNQWSSPDADRWAGEATHLTSTASSNEDPFFSTGVVNSENFADFSTKFGEPTNEPFGAPPPSHKHGVGDTTNTTMQPIMSPTVSLPKPQVAHQFSIRDKREIQNSIRKQRARNEILIRSSSELHSELQEVVEQRISLEIQLEHLKPC